MSKRRTIAGSGQQSLFDRPVDPAPTRPPQRALTCVLCATPLTGKQQRYCSNLCAHQAYAQARSADGRVAAERKRNAATRARWDKANRWRYKVVVNGPCLGCRDDFTGIGPASPYCADCSARRKRRNRDKDLANELRRLVFERDDWTCRLCGKPIDRSLRVPHPEAATLDHVIPRALGGAHDLSNLQCAHMGCNSSKGTRVI